MILKVLQTKIQNIYKQLGITVTERYQENLALFSQPPGTVYIKRAYATNNT